MASSEDQDILSEPTGTILKDSLAGESLASGGSFAANNPHAGISPQTARGTTTNNTDTSGAYRLDPAPDAEAREAAESWTEEGQLKAGKNLGSDRFGGSNNDHGGDDDGSVTGYESQKQQQQPSSGDKAHDGDDANRGASNNEDEKTDGAEQLTGRSDHQTGSDHAADKATTHRRLKRDEDEEAKGEDDNTTGPSYAAAAGRGAEREQEGRDRERKDDEGFGGDEQNASFTSDIGDENDPGRLAEQKFQTAGARSGADAGSSGPRQMGVGSAGQYDALEADTEV